MNVRGDTPGIAAACASVIRPVTQTGNARNSALARALLFIIVLFCAWSSPELGRVIA
jgi:hypothetical protein